jgi:hypothetical protein
VQSWAKRVAALLLLGVTSCSSNALADSIWPPADFEVAVEEVRVDNGMASVVRRFRARADGIVSYGTSARAVVDAATGTALPVFERLSVYELVPTSIRALARRIERCGILDLDRVQGERGVVEGPSLVVVWQAFGRRKVITARGRVHGAMAEVLAIVRAHLPDGETFGLPGLAERPVLSVLRGVPAPRSDAVGALESHHELLARRPQDRTLLLDAFALACDLGRRSAAEELLTQWLELTAGERREQEMFPEGEPRLTAALLERLLPPG